MPLTYPLHTPYVPIPHPCVPLIHPFAPLCAPYALPMCPYNSLNTPYAPLTCPYGPFIFPLHAPYASFTYPLCTPYMPLIFPLQVSDWLMVPTTANQNTGIYQLNLHKILIFFPTISLKRLCTARIDQLTDSNGPAMNQKRLIRVESMSIAISLHDSEHKNSSEDKYNNNLFGIL